MSNQTSSKVEQAIDLARSSIRTLLDEAALRPQCIRIAFLDAISYNPFTQVDGPNGSIRMWEGLQTDDEMRKAIERLEALKAKKDSPLWSYVSYADLYQLAGIEAVKKAGGPSIEFQHGRTDSCIPIDSTKIPKIDEDPTATSVKAVFHHIGFTDKEIVALSSAYYYWLNYPRADVNISHSYYAKMLEEEKAKADSISNTANTSTTTMDKQPNKSATNITTITTNTTTTSTTSTVSSLRHWKCLLSDASFRHHVELFAKEPNEFSKAYAGAHKKLSELGFKQFPQPIPKEVEYHEIKHGIAFAVAMTILFGFVSFFYESMRT